MRLLPRVEREMRQGALLGLRLGLALRLALVPGLGRGERRWREIRSVAAALALWT